MQPSPSITKIWGLSRTERQVAQGRLVECERVGSTMDVARDLLRTGAADLAGVRADYQSAGRGRQGGVWLAPPGASLLVTYVVHARGTEDFARNLPFAVGAAVAEAIEEVAGVTVQLKWPNDLLIGGKKVAGIIAETASIDAGGPKAERGLDPAYLVGIGVNVNVERFPAELAEIATSLEIETGLLTDIDEMEDAVRRHLFQLAFQPWTEILGRWRSRDDTAGRRYRTADGVDGIAESVNDQGILRLRCGDRIVETLAATAIR